MYASQQFFKSIPPGGIDGYVEEGCQGEHQYACSWSQAYTKSTIKNKSVPVVERQELCKAVEGAQQACGQCC